MPAEDWLRSMTDDELAVVAIELEQRQEFFDTKTRSLLNDELRRRKMPTVVPFDYGRPDPELPA